MESPRAVLHACFTRTTVPWTLAMGLKFPVVLPRDSGLFDTLHSASSQWLHILTVRRP